MSFHDNINNLRLILDRLEHEKDPAKIIDFIRQNAPSDADGNIPGILLRVANDRNHNGSISKPARDAAIKSIRQTIRAAESFLNA